MADRAGSGEGSGFTDTSKIEPYQNPKDTNVVKAVEPIEPDLDWLLWEYGFITTVKPATSTTPVLQPVETQNNEIFFDEESEKAYHDVSTDSSSPTSSPVTKAPTTKILNPVELNLNDTLTLFTSEPERDDDKSNKRENSKSNFEKSAEGQKELNLDEILLLFVTDTRNSGTDGRDNVLAYSTAGVAGDLSHTNAFTDDSTTEVTSTSPKSKLESIDVATESTDVSHKLKMESSAVTPTETKTLSTKTDSSSDQIWLPVMDPVVQLPHAPETTLVDDIHDFNKHLSLEVSTTQPQHSISPRTNFVGQTSTDFSPFLPKQRKIADISSTQAAYTPTITGATSIFSHPDPILPGQMGPPDPLTTTVVVEARDQENDDTTTTTSLLTDATQTTRIRGSELTTTKTRLSSLPSPVPQTTPAHFPLPFSPLFRTSSAPPPSPRVFASDDDIHDSSDNIRTAGDSSKSKSNFSQNTGASIMSNITMKTGEGTPQPGSKVPVAAGTTMTIAMIAGIAAAALCCVALLLCLVYKCRKKDSVSYNVGKKEREFMNGSTRGAATKNGSVKRGPQNHETDKEYYV